MRKLITIVPVLCLMLILLIGPAISGEDNESIKDNKDPAGYALPDTPYQNHQFKREQNTAYTLKQEKKGEKENAFDTLVKEEAITPAVEKQIQNSTGQQQ